MNDESRHARDRDGEFTAVFGHAAPRPRARAEAELAAFEHLHAQWRDLVARRRRRKIYVLGTAAAAVLIAIAIGFGVSRESAYVPLGESVAVIERRAGAELSWRAEGARQQPIAGDATALRVGQHLSTGRDSRVALGWHAGGSLRLDENSEIELVSAHSVRLVAGSVYFDSAASGQTPARSSC
jgi:hypothetical protein